MSTECNFCKKSFQKESSLAIHMCEPKRRHREQDERGVQLGLQAYLKFYESMQGTAKLKTFSDFAESSYYRAFVKFGRYCVATKVISPSRFLEWLLKNNKKSKSKQFSGLIMTKEAVIERLLAFNKWRTGEDDRTMDEADLKPRQITLDIEFAIKELQKL